MLIARQFALELHEELLAVFGKAAAIDKATASHLDASEKRRLHEQLRLERIFEALTGYHSPVDTH
jgi:hypothetical protein